MELDKQMLINFVDKRISKQINLINKKMIDLSLRKLNDEQKLTEWKNIREELTNFEKTINPIITVVRGEISNKYNLVTLEEKEKLIEKIRLTYMEDKENLTQQAENQIRRYENPHKKNSTHKKD